MFYDRASNGNITIGKYFFAVNMPLELFPATVANADIGNVKSLHTFLKNYFYHTLVKFDQIVQTKLHET